MDSGAVHNITMTLQNPADEVWTRASGRQISSEADICFTGKSMEKKSSSDARPLEAVFYYRAANEVGKVWGEDFRH